MAIEIKMPNIDFKAILGRLSFLKDNLNYLVPVVIVVVAVALFLPTRIVGGRLRQRIERESVAAGRKLDALRRESTPTDQWKVESEYQRLYAEDANRIERTAIEASQRPTLSTRIFPEPTDQSQEIFEKFGESYCEGIERMIAGVNGREGPSEAEIAQQAPNQGLAEQGMMDEQYMTMGPQVTRGSAPAMTQGEAPLGRRIADAICMDRARQAGMYVNRDDIAGYDFWAAYEYAGADQAVQDCWWWQLGYWVIEDVFDTIAACNAGSTSVFASPVKRIRFLGFTRFPEIVSAGYGGMDAYGDRYGSAGGYGQGGAASPSDLTSLRVQPKYVMAPGTASGALGVGTTLSQDQMVIPCTGRYSSDRLHIIHFNVVVVIRAKDVMGFMKQLCSAKSHRFNGFQNEGPERTLTHNPISILDSVMRPVVSSIATHQYYRYGDESVVELSLICEYLFDRVGYAPIFPKILKAPDAAGAPTP